jgi:hypothetical protein
VELLPAGLNVLLVALEVRALLLVAHRPASGR